MREALDIEVHGVVQGVGFRPFVFNAALRHQHLRLGAQRHRGRLRARGRRARRYRRIGYGNQPAMRRPPRAWTKSI